MGEEPTIGGWYETEEGEAFTVFAVDKASGLIDIQYLSGKVDQFDREVWAGLNLIAIEPPEEWRASMDDFFRERGRKK